MNRAIALFALFLASGLTAGDIVWKGEITLSEEVRIDSPGRWVVEPGTVVRFLGLGRLVRSGGQMLATGATFIADSPLDGEARIRLDGVSGMVRECVFRGLETRNRKWHDASFSWSFSSDVRFLGNVLEGCSALEFVHCPGAVANDNRFRRCRAAALVFFQVRDGVVRRNAFRDCRQEAVRLNAATECLVENNRIFNAATGVCVYGAANNNQILGNSVFDGTWGFTAWGGAARNLFMSNLTDQCSVGLRVYNPGPDNVWTNGVFWRAGYAFSTRELRPGVRFTVQNTVLSGNAGDEGLTLKNNFILDGASPALFVDPENGDFRPLPNSPLRNAGARSGTAIGLFP